LTFVAAFTDELHRTVLSRLNPIHILTLSFSNTICMLYLSQSWHFLNLNVLWRVPKNCFPAFYLTTSPLQSPRIW